MAREFAEERALLGECGLFAVHDKPGNGHFHLQTFIRGIQGDEFATSKLEHRTSPTRRWGDLMRARALGADIQNRALALAGYDLRTDHRSFEDQGIRLLPTTHEGPGFHAEGSSRSGQSNADVRRSNARTLTRHPEIILKELDSKHAVITQASIASALSRRMPSAPPEWISSAAAVLATSDHVRRIGRAADGTPLLRHEETEKVAGALRAAATRLAAATECAALDPGLMPALRADERAGRLSEKRVEDLDLLLRGGDCVVAAIEPARSRKLALGKALDAWDKEGRQRLGIAPTPGAARILSAEIGCQALAVLDLAPAPTRRLPRLDTPSRIPEGSILLIDEAEAYDIRTMARISAAASSRKAKMVLLADPAALRSNDAGAALRVVASAVPTVSLLAEAERRSSCAAALAMVQEGRPLDAAKALMPDGRLSFADGFEAVAEAALAFHAEARAAGRTAFVAVSTREQAQRLNAVLRPPAETHVPDRAAEIRENPHKAALEDPDARHSHVPKPGPRRPGILPPAVRRNRLRNVPQLDVAGIRRGGEVLLPDHLRVGMDDGDADPHDGLRRPLHHGLSAEERLIERPGRKTTPLPVRAGDRLALPTDILGGQPVRAGSCGTAAGFDGEDLVINLDDGRRIRLSTRFPIAIEHGWAAASHLGIRMDADRVAIAVLDRRIDRQTASRLLSRAREDAMIVADASAVPSLGPLVEAIGRDGARVLSPEADAEAREGKDTAAVRRYMDIDREAERIHAGIWTRTGQPETDPDWPRYAVLDAERRDAARLLVAAKQENRAAASALRAEWGVIERHARNGASPRILSMKALRTRHPGLGEAELREMRIRLAAEAREGIDAPSRDLIGRLMSSADLHRSLHARIREESGGAPSSAHRDHALCARVRAGRNAMAAAMLRDPALFRPALAARSRRWRDIERWAAAHERDRMAAIWRAGPDAAAMRHLDAYAEARSDASWEAARKGAVEPHALRRNHEADAAMRTESGLLRRAPEIGLPAKALEAHALSGRISSLIDEHAAARASGNPAAPAIAFDLVQRADARTLRRHGIADRSQLLLDAAEFERRVPARERSMLVSLPKLPESQRDEAALRWTADPLFSAWMDRTAPAAAADLRARADVLRADRGFERSRT
nr:AAA family ATPase [Magnetospirillum sp. XM-1]